MIRTRKLTPLAYGYRVTSRRPPQPELTVFLRAKLRCAPGEPCELLRASIDKSDDRQDLGPEAASALEEAEYVLGQGPPTAEAFEDGDDDRSGQLRYPGDFAEFKPKAEVMLRGTCHPPRNSIRCPVGLMVTGHDGSTKLNKVLEVYGPRVWVDRLLGGKLSDPVTFESMPVDYHHAYGGPKYAQNPCGMGHGDDERVPSIEDPRHPLDLGEPPLPAGFGPINSEWPLRRDKLGKAWGSDYAEKRAPWYAADYDWTHQNAAPPDQQLDHYLRGDETLRFIHLHPKSPDFSVTLPGLRPRAFVELTGGQRAEVPLACDTLFADLDDSALYVTWRGHTPVAEDDLSDVAFLLVAHEKLADEPLPAQHYLDQLADFSADPVGLSKSPVATLQKWEEHLESGELERRLQQIRPDEDPIQVAFGDLMGLAPHSTALVAALEEATKRANAEDPKARQALIAQLERTLRDLREGGGGGGGGGLPVDTSGKNEPPDAGPLMRSVMQTAAMQQKDAIAAGADMSAMNAELQSGLRAANIPGVTADDLAIVDPSAPPPEPVPGADFRGRDLTDRDLSNLDLSGCLFDGATLVRTNFTASRLDGASFVTCSLSRTKLEDARCVGASFRLARFLGTQASGADFSQALFDQTMLHKCDLSRAKLVGVRGGMSMVFGATLDAVDASEASLEKWTFDECSLLSATFKRATLPYTLFRKCALTEARFDAADLAHTAFFECSMKSAVFYGARGDTTNFKDTMMRSIDASHSTFPSSIFMGVDARGARFFAADMPRARFYRASLREAVFDHANLFEADLRKTSLTDARFNAANLYGSAFIEAYGTDADFARARLGKSNFQRNKLVKR